MAMEVKYYFCDMNKIFVLLFKFFSKDITKQKVLICCIHFIYSIVCFLSFFIQGIPKKIKTRLNYLTNGNTGMIQVKVLKKW